jgi:ActR/RegA family two-component response regulator
VSWSELERRHGGDLDARDAASARIAAMVPEVDPDEARLPVAEPEWLSVARELLAAGVTQAETARRLGVCRVTMLRRLGLAR